MVRTLKFIAAMLIALSIAVEAGWVTVHHPGLQHFHHLLLKWLKMVLYVLFP